MESLTEILFWLPSQSIRKLRIFLKLYINFRTQNYTDKEQDIFIANTGFGCHCFSKQAFFFLFWGFMKKSQIPQNTKSLMLLLKYFWIPHVHPSTEILWPSKVTAAKALQSAMSLTNDGHVSSFIYSTTLIQTCRIFK